MSMSRTRPTLLVAAVLATLAVGLESAAAGAPPLSERHRDPVHKFSLEYFRDWKQVPLQPGEKTTVAKFSDPKGKGQMRGTFDPEIEVFRVLKGERTDVAITGGPGRGGRFGPKPPEDVWEAAFGRFTQPRPWDPSYKPLDLDREDFEEIESEDEIEGKLWTYEVEVPSYGRRKLELFMMLAAFERNDVEYGVFMTCGGKLRRHFARPFERVAESFQFFDEKAEDVESLEVLDGVNISPRRRRDIERGMVTGWDVIVSPKKNYVVLYNTKEDKNHRLAEEIAERIEKIREQIYEKQFPPAEKIEAVCIVRVCGDRREYHAYGGPGGSAGYWNPGSEELVFYDASPSKKIDDDTLSVLYHEAFHQYIHYSVGRVAPHSWFNEGHGDYYAGAEYDGRKFEIDVFRWRRGVIQNAIAHGPRKREEVEEDGKKVERWGNEGYTPLEDFVRFSQREYYSYASVSYAQGWSFIYFLREVVPTKRAWREKWGHILDVYFDTLKEEVAEARGRPLVPGGRRPGEEDEEPADEDEEGGEDDAGEDDGGDQDEGDDELDPETGGIPRMPFRGGNEKALEAAVEKAFADVDWEELEEAWRENFDG